MKKITKCPKGHKEIKRSGNGWGVKTGPGKIALSSVLYYCEKCNEHYPAEECVQEL